MAEPPWRLAGPWAILLVHAYTMYVYFYLFTAAGLSRPDGSHAEAAAGVGAVRAGRAVGGPPGARVPRVRLLLPVHRGGAVAAGRLLRRGRGGAGGRALDH